MVEFSLFRIYFESGSTAELMTVIEYKTEKAAERLTGMEEKIAEEENRLEMILIDRQDVEQIEAYADDVSRMGRYNNAGNIEVTEKQHMMLTTLAREGLYSRRTIKELNSEVELWKGRFHKILERFKSLHEQTREMRVAFCIVPEKIKETITNIFRNNKVLADKEKVNDISRLDYEVRDFQINKTKSYERIERSR